MLGSLDDADDAVQNGWLRLSTVDADEIDNLGGWLTTVVGRECLHLLRSRRRRREELVEISHLPDPVVTAVAGDPEQEAMLADAVGLALLVVLDSLTPAERLAFVMHDMFDIPYDAIAPLIDRSSAAARQLASRARRRIRGARLVSPDRNRVRQREIVDAFYAAANTGNFDALVELLDPDVVFRADYGPCRSPAVYRGAATVAHQARAARGADIHAVLINGLPGVVTFRNDGPISLMAFTIGEGRILEIDGIRDADRVRKLTKHAFHTNG